ncbi:MAG TPA: hypothetical protein VJG83_00675 [archaeon]|nr:hypothetical protein [archaeon]
MLNKGLIGPIGDDLPSLIPILLGLVMFFSTFTLAFNAFDERNAEFNDDIAVMRVSRILQSNSYIPTYAAFEELCSEVGLVNLKYVAAITTDAVNGVVVENIFEISFFENSAGNTYLCTNTTSSGNTISDFISFEEAQDRKLVSRIFPIVIEDEKIVKPMHLVVVAWK